MKAELVDHSPGTRWRDGNQLPEMVVLPSGEFRMGAVADDKFANTSEEPLHRVGIAYHFALSRAPITVDEYRAFHGGWAPGEQPELPVVAVSWYAAIEYCNWLRSRTGNAYRLPSESEWEFACRAGSAQAFATGDAIEPSQANYLYSEHGERVGAGGRTPVGAYPENAFGLVDMHGNVCEWVEDGWWPNHADSPVDGTARPVTAGETYRVIRGGAWDYLPRLLRASWRDGLPADAKRDNVGFRVALTLT